MALKIDRANINQVPLLVDIFNQALGYKLVHKDLCWGSEPYTHKEVKGFIESSLTYTCSISEELVGAFILQWEDKLWGKKDYGGYIHKLAIKDGWHGRGLGEEIINWALAEVTRNGRKFLRLDCDLKNTKLCTYYEKLGFKLVGTKDLTGYSAALYELTVKA